MFNKWKEEFAEFLSSIPDSVKVSFIAIPHCTQVNEKHQKQYKLLGAKVTSEMLQTNYTLLEEIRKEFPKVHILDPLPYFQQIMEKENSLYYSNDPHLTPFGNKVLAEYLITCENILT